MVPTFSPLARLLSHHLFEPALRRQGRLSEEEIERMVREAEEYAEEDKAVKDRIDARNSLESYLYNMKNLLDDEEKGVSDKISEADKEVSWSWLSGDVPRCVLGIDVGGRRDKALMMPVAKFLPQNICPHVLW